MSGTVLPVRHLPASSFTTADALRFGHEGATRGPQKDGAAASKQNRLILPGVGGHVGGAGFPEQNSRHGAVEDQPAVAAARSASGMSQRVSAEHLRSWPGSFSPAGPMGRGRT